jgi:hypothetical protein
MATPDALRNLADLLDEDDVFDLVVGAIADARDRRPRAKGDADSADVLNHVIDVLRAESRSTT